MSRSDTPTSVPQPFAKQAATFSLLAPLISIFIGIFGQQQVRGNRAAMMILGLASTLLILLGLILGIAALVSSKRHGVQGVRGRAIAGTCICGILTLLMLLSIPVMIRVGQRAKERQRQQQMDPRPQ